MSNDEGLSNLPASVAIADLSLIRHSSFVLRHSRSGRVSWPAALMIAASIAAAVVLLIFWRIETWPGRAAHQTTDELEKLGRDLRAAFVEIAHLQPRARLSYRVYPEQTV